MTLADRYRRLRSYPGMGAYDAFLRIRETDRVDAELAARSKPADLADIIRNRASDHRARRYGY